MTKEMREEIFKLNEKNLKYENDIKILNEKMEIFISKNEKKQ
jgi:hypothetical protein